MTHPTFSQYFPLLDILSTYLACTFSIPHSVFQSTIARIPEDQSLHFSSPLRSALFSFQQDSFEEDKQYTYPHGLWRAS